MRRVTGALASAALLVVLAVVGLADPASAHHDRKYHTESD